MKIHYSAPKGFVGRVICHSIEFDDIYYGHIIGGSATLHLSGRHEFLGTSKTQLNNIINNIFFHVHKVDDKYPIRNFVSEIIKQWVPIISRDWQEKYSDIVLGLETLVELPRTGECYRRAGWTEVGTTTGYTCKRTSGKGTDRWTGKRVWDTNNLRPKKVFCLKMK